MKASETTDMGEAMQVGIGEAQERVRIKQDKVALAFTRIVI